MEIDQQTQKISKRYEYYPYTRYGSHGKQIKYKFDINQSGYGLHGKNIKYKFTLDSNGYLLTGNEREQGTNRILSQYVYMPKTTYERRWSRINGVKLNVPIINQLPELPTGCEITAVTMALQCKGIRGNKNIFGK